MDSMRTLNTSLPHAYSGRPAPPEQLLQAFRTAALSVTNLYKAAVTDQSNNRQAGYQDALEDLLGFLDRENLGLQDGEGWRVRQWITERFDGTANQHASSETDDDKSEADLHNHSTTTKNEQNEQNEPASTTEEQSSGASSLQPNTEQTQGNISASAPIFIFSGGKSANDDMQTDDRPPTPEEIPTRQSSPPAPIRVELVNRNTRLASKPSSSRHNARSSIRDFTFTAGSKRKLHFPDFFDISNINPRDDTNSKRGRFV